MLMKALDSYLAIRRAAGFKLKAQEYILRSFARFASERGENHIRTASVMEWASQIKAPWYRLEPVAPFARYLHAEDEQHEVPPSRLLGRRPPRRIPFIFSQDELNRLLQAAMSHARAVYVYGTHPLPLHLLVPTSNAPLDARHRRGL